MRSEKRIEKAITDLLGSWEIYPFSVTCTFCLGDGEGIVGITMFFEKDVEEFLDRIGYKSLCDKSGCIVKGNTILLSGLTLIKLYVG